MLLFVVMFFYKTKNLLLHSRLLYEEIVDLKHKFWYVSVNICLSKIHDYSIPFINHLKFVQIPVFLFSLTLFDIYLIGKATIHTIICNSVSNLTTLLLINQTKVCSSQEKLCIIRLPSLHPWEPIYINSSTWPVIFVNDYVSYHRIFVSDDALPIVESL